VEDERETNEPESAVRDWTRAGALLVVAGGLIHLGLGIAAIAGADGLEANVREIESNEDYGTLYFGLAVWGFILALLGAGELAAGRWAWSGTQNGWLAGLIAAFLGLGGSFFALAIFRTWAILALCVLLAAAFLLAYHSRHRV
jgi:hypothetical protein